MCFHWLNVSSGVDFRASHYHGAPVVVLDCRLDFAIVYAEKAAVFYLCDGNLSDSLVVAKDDFVRPSCDRHGGILYHLINYDRMHSKRRCKPPDHGAFRRYKGSQVV
eukprot:scaffold36812_cov16-Prasinocladus_malaysianus.AAC.1